MASGITGTGPYSQLRTLRQEIRNCEYEIFLIEEGIKHGSKTGYKKRIVANRLEIKNISAEIKKKK